MDSEPDLSNQEVCVVKESQTELETRDLQVLLENAGEGGVTLPESKQTTMDNSSGDKTQEVNGSVEPQEDQGSVEATLEERASAEPGADLAWRNVDDVETTAPVESKVWQLEEAPGVKKGFKGNRECCKDWLEANGSLQHESVDVTKASVSTHAARAPLVAHDPLDGKLAFQNGEQLEPG